MQRYASFQERYISPEGTYPVFGRSSTYRVGAFQPLAKLALDDALPKDVSPAQVRCALTAVMKRMFVPNTFLALSDHRLIGRAVVAFNGQVDAARQASDYVRSRNGSFIPGCGLKLATGHMPQRISANIRRTNKRYQSILRQCDELPRPRHVENFQAARARLITSPVT